jgi:hypothetical protein
VDDARGFMEFLPKMAFHDVNASRAAFAPGRTDDKARL